MSSFLKLTTPWELKIIVAIRRTTAIMLLDLVSVHPTLIQVQFNQVLRHVLTLLSEPLHVSGLAKQVEEESHVATVGKSQGMRGGSAGSSSRQGRNNNNKTDKQQPLMPIVLSVLSAIFNYHGSSSIVNSSSVPLCTLNHNEYSANNSVIIIRKKRRSFLEGVWSSSSVDATDQFSTNSYGTTRLEPSISHDLVVQLKKIWMGLETNPTALKKDTVSVMQEMCSTLIDMMCCRDFCTVLLHTSSNELVSFLRTGFKNFPHNSYEGLNIEKSIESNRQLRYPVIALDMSLCHLAFVVYRKIVEGNDTYTALSAEGLQKLSEMNITAKTYVNDKLLEAIEKSSSMTETCDSEDKRWFAVLIYLSTSRCKFFQFINDLMIDGLQGSPSSSSSSSSSSSRDPSRHVDILNVLIQLIKISISCPEYAAGNSALETKFVRPALHCVCELMESCKLWDYLIHRKGHGLLYTSDDKENSKVCSEGMIQVSSMAELLDSVCTRTFPVWLQASKVPKGSNMRYMDGIRRVIYTILAIVRRSFGEQSSKLLANTTLLRFFKPFTMIRHESNAGKKKSTDDINDSQQMMYHLFDNDVRKAVLETIFYCFPYLDNVVDTAYEILNCVFLSMNSLEEPKIFLEIVLHCASTYVDGNGKAFPLHDVMKRSLENSLSCAINYVEGEKDIIASLDINSASLLLSANSRNVLSFISENVVNNILAQDVEEKGEDLCLEMIDFVAGSVLLPGYRPNNAMNLTWKEMLIRVAMAHTIIIAAFRQQYSLVFTHQERYDNAEEDTREEDIPAFITNSIELYSKILISLFCSEFLPSHVFDSQTLGSGGVGLHVTDSIITMFADIGALFVSQINIDSAYNVETDQFSNKKQLQMTPIDIFRETFLKFYEMSSSWSYNKKGVKSCLRVMSNPELLKRLPRKKVKSMFDLAANIQ